MYCVCEREIEGIYIFYMHGTSEFGIKVCAPPPLSSYKTLCYLFIIIFYTLHSIYPSHYSPTFFMVTAIVFGSSTKKRDLSQGGNMEIYLVRKSPAACVTQVLGSLHNFEITKIHFF